MEPQHVLLAWIGTSFSIGVLWQIAQLLPPAGKKAEILSLSSIRTAIEKLCHPEPNWYFAKIETSWIHIDDRSIAWDSKKNQWSATVLPTSYFGYPVVVWTRTSEHDETTGKRVHLNEDEYIHSFTPPWDSPKHSKSASAAIKRYTSSSSLSSLLARHTIQKIGYGYTPVECYTWATSQFSHFDLSHLMINMTFMAVSGAELIYACPQITAWDLHNLLLVSLVGSAVASSAGALLRGRQQTFKGASGVWYGLAAATALLVFGTAETKAAEFLGISLLLRHFESIRTDVVAILKDERDGIDHAGHIGGALPGFVFAMAWLWQRA